MRLWILFSLFSAFGLAAETTKLWYYNIDNQQLAIHGYDVVAYFNGKAMKGDAQFQASWQGLTYHFSNRVHLQQFKAEPSKYVPQYGGWCAFAIGVDKEKYNFGPTRFDCDPESFKVVNDKLYLFANLPNFKAKDVWNREDEAAMIQRADAFWQTREKLAAQIGRLPAGMNPRAPMETAQFAFIIGKWKTETKWMNNLKEKTYGPTVVGLWEAYYDWEGFGVTDNWRMPNVPGSGGPAFRSYDPQTQKWVMTYIPSNQPRKNVWVMEGAFDDKGELTGEFSGVDSQGRAFKQKVFFYNIKPNSFSWRSDRSYDEGETWIESLSTSEQTRMAN